MAKQETKRSLRQLLRVRPGEKVDLAAFDCGATFGRKKEFSRRRS